MNNLALRAVSGTLYVALIVCSLIFSDLFFCILCVVFGVLAVVEFDNLTSLVKGPDDKAAPGVEIPTSSLSMDVFGIIAMTLPCIGVTFFNSLNGLFVYCVAGAIMWLLFAVMRFCMTLWQTDTEAVRRLAFSIFGQIYIGLGLVSAQFLSLQSSGLVLLVFILIWINDTGAFLVGSAIGRRKLFPRLSPGKSWEGFFGGLFLGIAVSIALLATGLTGRLLHYPIFSPWEVTFALPLTVGIAGTLGDLFESMVKRSVGAKDSGNLIPGHGGILDRIDSMLFAMPATILLLLLCGIID